MPVPMTPVQIAEVSYDLDLLAVHAASPERYPFLLESTAKDDAQGRFDILFALPGARLELNASGVLSGALHGGDSFLGALDGCWRAERCAAGSTELPFTGGWFLLLGYELASEIEPRLTLPADAGQPVALAVRAAGAVIRDHREQRAWLVAEASASGALAQLQADLAAASSGFKPGHLPGPIRIGEPPADLFVEAVRRARQHIRAGDVFQANLSREWRAELSTPVCAAGLYAQLRKVNPGPFAGLAVDGQLAVISSSPERLVRVRDGRVETRPIAGTRARSGEASDDAPRRAELLADPKEIAEHVMLIDLERNDLGRICQPGSVAVDEFMVVESYSHVHHIVSNVSGRLREGVTPGHVLRAVFPGGTITGCPKVRCMEIIAALEDRPRGFYTGAMGYLNRDGSMDLNILIRTIVAQGRSLSVAAGSGIVADSDPERELEETRAKAKGMLLALN